MAAPNELAKHHRAGQIDAVVAEVFCVMLNRSCTAQGVASANGAAIFAQVRFSGSVEGVCVVEFAAEAAQRLACAFLGSEDSAWDDTMIEDAVGELCNMIAGGWKAKLGEAGSECRISVPLISRGVGHAFVQQDARPHSGSAVLRRAYLFAGSEFRVVLELATSPQTERGAM